MAAVITGVMIFTGLSEINQANQKMVKLANVDMVMNEAVIQNIIRVQEGFKSWALKPSKDNWSQLQEKIENTKQGLKSWQETSSDYPELVKEADRGLEEMNQLETELNNYKESLNLQKEVYKDWRTLIDETLVLLEDTMKNYIDPQKEQAANEENIAAMKKWFNIDMVMNEAVIANFLKLQTVTNLYIENPSTQEERLHTAIARLETGVKEWKAVCAGDEKLIEVIEKIEAKIEKFKEAKIEYEAEHAEVKNLKQKLNAHLEDLVGSYNQVMEEKIDPLETKAQKNIEVVSRSLKLRMGIVILAVILVIIFSLYMSKKLIANPLEKIAGFTSYIKEGDLSKKIEIEREDEIGELASGFNEMQEHLQEVISNIKEVIEDLSAYSQELSASAEEGNATVNTTKELIENMSAGIEEISAGAQEVTSFAEEATSKTDVGQENIEQTISSMKKITNSVEKTVKIINELDNTSHEIGEIVALITDISEQTNLLALNAAIEAARAGAGQQGGGQGFAVVAEEIRELAEQTNDATNEISKLVSRIQNKSNAGLKSIKQVDRQVKEGEKIAEETGEVFAEIRESSEETAAQIEQTASAARELAENSEEVEIAADDIKNMSNEIANSSQELTAMAQDLQELIGQFKS